MFICCNMHVERTVRVVHGLSSSSFISLKIYLHFMIKHFNLTHVSHCHRKSTMFGCIKQEVDPFSSHQERISSFSLGRLVAHNTLYSPLSHDSDTPKRYKPNQSYWRKLVLSGRITHLLQLSRARQLFLHFLTKLGEMFA